MSAPKAPSNITQTSKVELGPEQKEVFNLAMPSIKEYAGSTPSLFPGSGIAPLDPSEIAAQQYAEGVAAPTGAALGGRSAATQAQLMNPDFMLNPNQYVNAAADSVTQKATSNLLESILPQIRSGSQMTGGMYSGGGSRQRLTELAAIGDTQSGISNALAQMYLQNYQQGLGQMGQAVQGNQNVMMQQLFPSNVMGAVGAQRRATQQAALDEQISKFYAQQDMPLLKSQQLLNLISGMPGGMGVSTVQGAMQQQNPMMQMLGMGMSLMPLLMGGGGAAAGGAGALAPLMMSSDRRLKTGIVFLDTHPKGFGIYSYRYIWDDPEVYRIGFMADEVEQVVPGAVETRNGFAVVNYSIL